MTGGAGENSIARTIEPPVPNRVGVGRGTHDPKPAHHPAATQRNSLISLGEVAATDRSRSSHTGGGQAGTGTIPVSPKASGVVPALPSGSAPRPRPAFA